MKQCVKHPNGFIYFDTSKVYLCPMIRSETKGATEIEDPIEVTLVEDKYGYFLIPTVPGYERKYFYDRYLDFLFKTNYITELP